MSSFYVTSASRNAVRKLLVSTGLRAEDVRQWPVSRLGAELRAKVGEGKVSPDMAINACNVAEAEIEFVPAGEQAKPTAAVKTGNALADAIAAAVQASMAEVPTGTDEAKVKAMIAVAIEEAKLKPAVIDIRTEKGDFKVEGRTHDKFDTVVRIVSTRIAGRRCHAWLVGPSGSGKSHLAKQVADSLKLNFYSTGAIQSKYDLIGFVAPSENPSTLMTPFRMAFEHGGVFSWDDCDASDPRAFVAFNEALSNGRFAFPDKQVEQHADFVAIASANTWGNGATADYVGRNKIDAATLSRFVRVMIDYDEELERDLVGKDNLQWARYVQKVRAAVSKLGVKVLVTPRQTMQGAALLAAGINRDEVERMTVYAGVDKDTESKLRAAA